MNPLARFVVRGVDRVTRRGKSVGVRLVRLTGKRPYAIHHDRPRRWKREGAVQRPAESTGFRVVARKRR